MTITWTRTDRKACPVCGKKGWCSVSTDGAIVHCMRQSSDCPGKNGGWIHRLDNPGMPDRSPGRSTPPATILTPAHLTDLNRQYQSRVVPGDIAGLASKLGVTVNSLRRLGIGHDGSAFTFPMFSGDGRLIGVHRRFPDGSKRCITGSKLGLFIPADLTGNGPLLICEGASDTAAALSIRFDAIGLPSAGNGFDHAAEFLSRRQPRHVVIMADLDEGTESQRGDVTWPGIESALKLAERLMEIVPDLHVCLPPDGIKDLRQWIGDASADEIKSANAKTPKVNHAWLAKARQNVDQNRQRRRMNWAQRASALLSTIDDPERRADLREQFEERAGIAEFDGGSPRDESERIAYEQIHHQIERVGR